MKLTLTTNLSLGVFFLAFLLTALWNPGFLALDEYNHSVVFYIPAQESSWAELVRGSGFRNPLQNLLPFVLAQTVYAFGVESPWFQYHMTLWMIAAVNAAIYFWGLKTLLAAYSLHAIKHKMLLFFALFFLQPFLLTRPMFESFAAPWLFLFVALGATVLKRKDLSTPKHILLLVIAIVCASIYRPQVGLSAFLFAGFLLWARQYKNFVFYAVMSVFAFVTLGLLDAVIRGGFHESLQRYWDYNIQHSSSYGVRPFWSYALLFLGASLFPFWMRKNKLSQIKAFCQEQAWPIAVFLLFLISHSLVPHKEERFMIPIFPVFVYLLGVWVLHLGPELTSWRMRSAVGLNTLLLVLISFFPSQQNIFSFVRYLDKHSQSWQKVVAVDEALVLFPDAFVRDIRSIEREQVSMDEFLRLKEVGCGVLYVARSMELPRQEPALPFVDEFRPGLMERLVIWLNPRHNMRRSALSLYGCEKS